MCLNVYIYIYVLYISLYSNIYIALFIQFPIPKRRFDDKPYLFHTLNDDTQQRETRLVEDVFGEQRDLEEEYFTNEIVNQRKDYMYEEFLRV